MVELKTIFIYLFVHCYTLQISCSSCIKFLKSEKVDLYLKTYSTLNKLARKTVFNFKAKKLSNVFQHQQHHALGQIGKLEKKKGI